MKIKTDLWVTSFGKFTVAHSPDARIEQFDEYNKNVFIKTNVIWVASTGYTPAFGNAAVLTSNQRIDDETDETRLVRIFVNPAHVQSIWDDEDYFEIEK